MDRRLSGAATALFCAVPLFFSSAHAQSWVDEVRFGVYDHDTGIIGTHKEAGADFALEFLSRPVTALRLIGTPRFVFGGVVNTAGKTNQIYFGIDKQLDFAHGLLSDHDALYIEGTIGGVWHSGKQDVRGTPQDATWKSHGSAFLFRPGLALGYRINRQWSVAISLNHISNAGLSTPNKGSNDLGLLIGRKL